MKAVDKKSGPKQYESILNRFDGNLWHFHFVVTKKIAAPFTKGTDRRVVCTLNKIETFQCALMPHGDGDYFINLNKKIRDKLKLKEGDKLTFSLQKDESEFGLPVTEELAELMNQDDEGSAIFKRLTPGKQRTLLYIAATSKSPDIRIKKAIAILTHLKATEGKINYRQLNELIKNAD